jgi:hypothetical protein
VVQLDIPLSNAKFYGNPKHVPGRVNTDDFVYFSWPATMNPKQYKVVVSVLDTAGPPLRSIGTLMKTVELPHVQFDPYGTIFVMPISDQSLPTFYARLSRASTYVIPDVRGKHRCGMKHEMRRHGLLLGGCDESKLAY